MSQKLEQLDKGESKRSGRNPAQYTDGSSTIIDSQRYKDASKESGKLAVELNHGMLVEALKNFMFTHKCSDHNNH